MPTNELRAQITMTVQESKCLIAEAIASLPIIRQALRTGKIFLKGGTTVSAVSQKLVSVPLWISGRITPSGTKSAMQQEMTRPHQIVIDRGEARDVHDNMICRVIQSLGKGDVVAISANAIDTQGNAAMMMGSPLGGGPGPAMTGIMAEGAEVIIAAGLEKLIPGTIKEAVIASGRKIMDVSYGLPVGLTPLAGTVITEKEACEILGMVKCTVIGAGGILGAEGATTLVIEGERREVRKVLSVIARIKGATITGSKESLIECGGERCAKCEHHSCIYRLKRLRAHRRQHE